MSLRRTVRTTDSFEADIDRQLPDERSAHGVPSRFDFLLYEVPHIIEAYASGFDELPTIAGAPGNVRALVGHGQLVRLYFIAGKLNEYDIIELQAIDIELWPPDR
ncbi:MAG: hypothetical protein ACRBK7_12230 [Acidimicrobiales bacterium]